MRRVIILAALLATGGLLTAASASATAYSFIQLGFTPTGINNSGEIVGISAPPGGAPQSLVYSGGMFTYLNVPGAEDVTVALGINDQAQVVGYFVAGDTGRGFLYSGGSYSAVDVPGFSTNAYGINNAGQIVGLADGHGFLYSGGNFTILDVPGGTGVTAAFDINNAGQIAGSFGVGEEGQSGFLYTGGSYETFAVPGAVHGTFPLGINDAGQIVGRYADSTRDHGFLYSDGNLTTIDVPGARSSFAADINDAGQIVGFFVDGTGFHGFLATPVVSEVPEPSTLALLSLGVIGLIFLRSRKSSQPAHERREAIKS